MERTQVLILQFVLFMLAGGGSVLAYARLRGRALGRSAYALMTCGVVALGGQAIALMLLGVGDGRPVLAELWGWLAGLAAMALFGVTIWRSTSTYFSKSGLTGLSNARFIRDLPRSVVVCDIAGRVISWNPSAQAMYGWSEAEARGRYLRDLIKAERPADLMDDMLAALDRGESYQGEAILTDCHGRSFPAEVLRTPLFDEQGKRIGSVGISRDISEREQRRAELQESRERFATLSAATFEAIVMLDGGRVVEANEQAQLLFGYALEEARGRYFAEFLAPPDRERALARFAEGCPNTECYQGLCRDGRVRDLEVNLRQLPYGGKPLAIVAMRDVTHRREAQQLLEASEQRYRAIVEDQSDFVCRYRPDGTITFANQALCRVRGQTSEEVVGLNIVDATGGVRASNPDEWRLFPTRPEECRPATLEVSDGEGGWFWHQWVVQPIYGEAGQVVEYQAVGRDITEQERTRRRLTQSEEKYRRLVELSPSGILLGYGGKIMFANRALATMLGVEEPSRMIGTAYLDWIHPDQHGAVTEQMTRALQGAQVLPRMELRLIRMDGVVFDAEVWAVPNQLEGRLVSQVILSDISDRKRSERERAVLDEQLRRAQRLETVGTLAAGIAHDFNNLLVPVLGYTEMTMGELPPESVAHERLQEVIKAGHRARDMITQLLAFSREQIGDRRVVQMGTLVEEVLVRLRPMQQGGVTIDYRCGHVLPSVLAEPGQLRQAILNILQNALDAVGDAGTISVRLESMGGEGSRCRVCHVTLRGAQVHLSVADAGRGMTRDVLAKIFDPFFSTKRVGEGSGLGLAVCHGIVTQHGGHLCADSRPGHGTTMHLYLPVAGAGNAGRAEPAEGGAARVLLLDGSPAEAEAAAWTLRRIGCAVTVCGQTGEVLDLARRYPGQYDLALVNHREVEQHGEEFLRQLAGLPAPVPVIVAAENPQRYFLGGRMLLPCCAIVRTPLLSQEIDRTIRNLRSSEIARQ